MERVCPCLSECVCVHTRACVDMMSVCVCVRASGCVADRESSVVARADGDQGERSHGARLRNEALASERKFNLAPAWWRGGQARAGASIEWAGARVLTRASLKCIAQRWHGDGGSSPQVRRIAGEIIS